MTSQVYALNHLCESLCGVWSCSWVVGRALTVVGGVAKQPVHSDLGSNLDPVYMSPPRPWAALKCFCESVWRILWTADILCTAGARGPLARA